MTTITLPRLTAGKVVYFNSTDYSAPADSFAFDGRVPESCLEQYVGCHPGHLVEGFGSMIHKADNYWMCRSRIRSVRNYLGTVLVELEPA